VKAPRLRIAWVMVAIVIAAINFGALRAFIESDRSGFLVLGALPMANVLTFGILIGLRRRGISPFLLGFEAFGAIALAIYLALRISFPNATVRLYIESLINFLMDAVGRDGIFLVIPIAYFAMFAVGVMLVSPQVAFAAMGGFLSRRYRITITRRQDGTPP
jgi:hypothetical protein